MQETAVIIIFYSTLAWAIYRLLVFFISKKKDPCASCGAKNSCSSAIKKTDSFYTFAALNKPAKH